MLKWVVGLCAAMYLALITVGEPTPEELAARAERDDVLASRSVTPTPVPDAPTVETQEPVVQAAAPAEDLVPTPAVTEPELISEIAAPALVSVSTDTTTPAASETVVTEQIVTAPAPAASIRRVTGRRVNLRAGPTTTSEIVGRAVRNDSAEVVELLPSGWAKVYILETGIEAYISAQFLSDAG
ncbi:MAG: SH3 domain-containing protein [Litoreibacter sp.]|uniref:SH3 domain-containing protein n=1 Tax=Litoreibacter sp. TaxID=1969459 RepID=UPI00329975B1